MVGLKLSNGATNLKQVDPFGVGCWKCWGEADEAGEVEEFQAKRLDLVGGLLRNSGVLVEWELNAAQCCTKSWQDFKGSIAL